jgi:CBS domain-containing protein
MTSAQVVSSIVFVITMEKYRIRDLPVGKERKLLGIASRVDIGRAFLSTWLDR